jgi:hypothetical protein
VIVNIRLTITALVLAVISVTAAMIIVPSATEGAARAAQRRLIATGELVIDDVTAIGLARRDGETLRFERAGDAWQQVEPITHPMDPFSIRQLIVQATEAQVLSEVNLEQSVQTVSAATLGLDPPLAVLTFETPGGRTTINLGRRGLGGRAYAQLAADDAVLVIKSDLHDRATAMDPREWRDRRLFSNVSVDAERIAFSAGNTQLELRRDGTQWTMAQPTATRADALMIEEYVANLAKAQVSGFILDTPESLERFGLGPGVAVLEVNAGGEGPMQRLHLGLQIGASTGDRFAMLEGRPTVVRMNQATVQALFPAPETLVDPTGSGVQPADVKTITIRTAESELVLQRDFEKWRATSHDGREISAALVEELLRQMTELRAPRVSIEPYPLEKQFATITFAGFGDKPLDTVRIVKDEATGQWGLENGDNVLRVFPASMKLRLAPADYGLAGFTP